MIAQIMKLDVQVANKTETGRKTQDNETAVIEEKA